MTAALGVLAAARRDELAKLIHRSGLGGEQVSLVLRAVEGARSASTSTLEPLWTMPGHLVQGSPLISSVPLLVRAATTSVTCSTYNFQQSSGLWQALHDAVHQPRSVRVRVYLDTAAAEPKINWVPPTPEQVAGWLKPGAVFRTVKLDGTLVRNHAKFLVVDHRWVLVTSANFSHSAEFNNVELGVKIDNSALAGSIEQEMRRAEDRLYERVSQ
jgi:phosphatidylserine/phosphatidylglycerophosphate/cardiolipin synthase-like enzyme